jgi:hypothetical protein
LALAWLGGVVSLPRALEPGRSEENGVRLNLLVDVGDGRVTNDWFTAAPAARISSSSPLRVQSTNPGPQVLSRPIAVFPHECYRLDVAGGLEKGTAVALVQDEDMKITLASVPLSKAEASDWQVVFSSDSFRRLTIVLASASDTMFSVASAELTRMSRATPCT